MRESRLQLRTRRPLIVAAPLLLVLAIASFALATGCGGGSSSSSNGSSTSGGNTAPPATSSTTDGAPATGTTAPPAQPALSGPELGAKVFKDRCALCHGPDGHGDGPGSKALNPKPRNFHDTAYMNSKTDAELIATIHSGKGAMPKWGGVLSEAEIAAVFAHVRELGKKP